MGGWSPLGVTRVRWKIPLFPIQTLKKHVSSRRAEHRSWVKSGHEPGQWLRVMLGKQSEIPPSEKYHPRGRGGNLQRAYLKGNPTCSPIPVLSLLK